MICRCTPEGASEADALIGRVSASLGLANPADLTSALVMWFTWEKNAYVELMADQWYGVSVIKYDGDEQLAFVACDRIEDGLAACYEELAATGG